MAPLTAMTFNLRYAHAEPPDLWPDRRPVTAELLARWSPDVVGTQEGEYHQVVELAQDLPSYRWIGLGREGGSHGELMAVFYRHERLVPLEFDHYWLSDTPALIGSRSWGNRDPRMVTWVRFLNRVSGRELYVLNTHLDHESQRSRECSASLILDQVARLDAALPLIVLGDFNAPAHANPVYDALVGAGPFNDVWCELDLDEPPLGTYHAFEGLDSDGSRGRIDWVLTRGAVEPEDAEVITFSRDGQYPSDHFPVAARLRI